MLLKNSISKALSAFGEKVSHYHDSGVYNKHAIITPVSKENQFSNDKISFPLGMLNKRYYSYITSVSEDENYSVGDKICTKTNTYEVCYYSSYNFMQDTVYVQAFLKESDQEDTDEQYTWV